jgi:hypothetical protein
LRASFSGREGENINRLIFGLYLARPFSIITNSEGLSYKTHTQYLGKFKPNSGGFEGEFKNYLPKAVPIAAKHKCGYASIQPLAEAYGEQKAHDFAALYSFPNKASFDGWLSDYKVSGLPEMRHELLEGQVTSYYSMAGEDVDYDALTHYVVTNKKFASAEAKEDFQTNYGSKIKDVVAQTDGCIIKAGPFTPEQREGFHQEDADDIQLTILIGFPSAEKRQAFHDIQKENGMKDVRERTLVGPLYNIDALPKDHPAFVSGAPFERKTM